MRRRILPATAAVTLLCAGLTGCATANSAADACEAPLAPGSLTESVTLAEANGQPEVEITSTAPIVNAQRSVLASAEDRAVLASEGTIVAANLAYFDSASGDLLEASPSFGSDAGDELFLVTAEGGPVLQGVLCAAPGDTLAIALPAELSAGAVETPDASLLVIVDVREVYPAAAEGRMNALPSGFPSVVTDEAGRVGMVLPPQAPPTETTSAARITGSGAEVQDDSMVIANVLTVSWAGEQLKNSWESGPENLGTVDQIAESGVTFRAELSGYPVGSQVVVIEGGDGNPRVSVIDILAIA